MLSSSAEISMPDEGRFPEGNTKVAPKNFRQLLLIMKLISNPHRSLLTWLKRGRITAIVLLILTGFNALAAGFSFMGDPSGSGMGMTTDYLEYSPFQNFFFPGLLLFTTIGVFSLIVAFLTIKDFFCYKLLLILQGCILTGWIFIQVLLVRDLNFLHIIFVSIGISLIFIGSLLKSQDGLF